LLTTKRPIDEYQRLTRAHAKIQEALGLGLEIVPKLWVYFSRERFDAAVVFKSEKYDFAVLEIKRQGPYFRLAPDRSNIHGARVFAVGYPIAASSPLTLEEAIQRPLRKPGENLPSVLNEDDSTLSINAGTVSDVHVDAETVTIQHTAAISAMNPGGPLILDDGTALGIITAVSFDNEQPGTPAKKRYALGLSQVQGELRRSVPAIFSK